MTTTTIKIGTMMTKGWGAFHLDICTTFEITDRVWRGVPPEDGERVSTTAKELETDLATEAAKADVRIELDKNCQRVQQELIGLLDRDHFPKMRKVTLVLNPYPHYLEKMLEML